MFSSYELANWDTSLQVVIINATPIKVVFQDLTLECLIWSHNMWFSRKGWRQWTFCMRWNYIIAWFQFSRNNVNSLVPNPFLRNHMRHALTLLGFILYQHFRKRKPWKLISSRQSEKSRRIHPSIHPSPSQN